jgi:hypothetical protein
MVNKIKQTKAKKKRKDKIPEGSILVTREIEYLCPVRGLVKETFQGYRIPSITYPEKMSWVAESIYKEDQEIVEIFCKTKIIK